tara:strand:- start:195 stop:647 length:453 start_codon:yes stop_codon:yes gene_type:complete
MVMAVHARDNSPDPSTKVGATVAQESGKIAAVGWNDFPTGVESTDNRWDDREQKYPRVIHAEAAALIGAMNAGISVKGGTLYTTEFPCCNCCGLIIQAGIKHVVSQDLESDYAERWSDQIKISMTMFEEAGVTLEVIPRQVEVVNCQSLR